MSNEERKPKRQEKVKEFLRKHERLLLVLGAGVVIVGGTTFTIIIGRRHKVMKKEAKQILDILQKNTTELPVPIRSVTLSSRDSY